MALSDLESLSKIFNDRKRRAVSLRARSLCDSWAFCLRLWSDLHCESKKLDPISFEHNFLKYCPILNNLSLLQREIISHKQNWISHFTYSLLLHYLEKCSRIHFTKTLNKSAIHAVKFIVVTKHENLVISVTDFFYAASHRACVHAEEGHFEYSLWTDNVDSVHICYIQCDLFDCCIFNYEIIPAAIFVFNILMN